MIIISLAIFNKLITLIHKKNPTVIIRGIPYSEGQSFDGLEKAPQQLRDLGIKQIIEKLGYNVIDKGDMFFYKIKDIEKPFIASELIRKECSESYSHQSININLGGDHSIAMGTVQASLLKNSQLKVIWIDAHGDMNTLKNSPSGNIHGMPLAALLGEIPDFFSGPYLLPENLVLIGVRSLDYGELELIERLKIKVFYMADIRRSCIETVMHKAISYLNLENNSSVHVSFDIDAVDPLYAPATGIQVAGGLLGIEAIKIARIISETKKMISMDLVEINPMIKNNKDSMQTLSLGLEITSTILRNSNNLA